MKYLVLQVLLMCMLWFIASTCAAQNPVIKPRPAQGRPGQFGTSGNNPYGNNSAENNNNPFSNKIDSFNNAVNGRSNRNIDRGAVNRSNNTNSNNDTSAYLQNLQDLKMTRNPFVIDPKIFGSELFYGSALSFEPDLRIATPVNYVLGPDDALAVGIYGLQEAAFTLTVSPEGTIYIPNVGQVMVSGLTVEAATARIRQRMSGIYSSLRTGASKLSVTLAKIRSIRVTIIGAAKSGTYTISSLSTLLNALFLSGGPAQNRSFRKIELLRNNKVSRVVDLYKFLLTGDQSDNVRLQDNDVVRLPVYDIRVEITGEVKRPGIYEMLKTENASDLITFASGFTDSAYKASVKVYQLTDIDRKIQDLQYAEFIRYVPNSGDLVEVSKILNRLRNRVSISGAVLRGGNFELTPGITVADVVKKAFLREDAYTARGQIIRTKDDLSKEIIPFDVAGAVNGSVSVPLKKEDQILIYSVAELRDTFNVKIQGEVRKPGTFEFAEGLTLKDLLLEAGGFSDAAYPQKIEVARVIKRDTLTAQDVRLSQIIEVNNLEDLSISEKNIRLTPYDVITVRRLPGYLALQSVYATGQVQFPGPYVLSNRLEKISDLLRRAGGVSPEAFTEGAYLRRTNVRDVLSDIHAQTVDKIQRELEDTTGKITAAVARTYDQIPLDLATILANPASESNMVLKPGDTLFIPKNDEEIKINGEVLFPTQSIFNKNKNLKDYVAEAGGFTDNARRSKAYVLYLNGKAASTKHFLFFRSYPKIRPGSEIVIPKEVAKNRQRRSAAEVTALASAFASLAYVIIALVRL
ncbi:MAG: SLBB domain-containing protein [Bacteroidota bacterium]|nr:SLBB domain-containing protein [Bacteroidota bacterium]